MSAARTERMRKRPPRPSDSSNGPPSQNRISFHRAGSHRETGLFCAPMNALHALPFESDSLLAPDPKTQFAIDPMANAQRYPKNEQPK